MERVEDGVEGGFGEVGGVVEVGGGVGGARSARARSQARQRRCMADKSEVAGVDGKSGIVGCFGRSLMYRGGGGAQD